MARARGRRSTGTPRWPGWHERYLAGHAPASDRDLARWSGLGLRDVRAGLAAVRVVERPDGLLVLPGQDPTPRCPRRGCSARSSRCCSAGSRATEVVGPHVGLVTSNGIFKAFALAGGRAVATWRASAGRLTLEPLEQLAPDVRTALDDDARDVLRFLGP